MKQKKYAKVKTMNLSKNLIIPAFLRKKAKTQHIYVYNTNNVK